MLLLVWSVGVKWTGVRCIEAAIIIVPHHLSGVSGHGTCRGITMRAARVSESVLSFLCHYTWNRAWISFSPCRWHIHRCIYRTQLEIASRTIGNHSLWTCLTWIHWGSKTSKTIVEQHIVSSSNNMSHNYGNEYVSDALMANMSTFIQFGMNQMRGEWWNLLKTNLYWHTMTNATILTC